MDGPAANVSQSTVVGGARTTRIAPMINDTGGVKSLRQDSCHPALGLVLLLRGGFDKGFRPSGAAPRQGLSGAGDFIVTVFFDAGDEREDPSQPSLDVGRQIQRIEGGAGGAKLRFRGLADFGAG